MYIKVIIQKKMENYLYTTFIEFDNFYYVTITKIDNLFHTQMRIIRL